MKCGDYEVLISAYADGELDAGMIPYLVNHIADCDRCRKLYEETCDIQSNIATALSLHIDTPDFTGSVASQICPRNRFVLKWIWAAAAVITVFVLGSLFLVKQNNNSADQVAVTVKQEKTLNKPLSAARRIYPTPERKIIGVRPDIMPEVKQKTNSRKSKSAPIMQLTEAKKLVAKHETKDPDQAEITVEYLDSVDSADQDWAKSLAIAPKIPTAGPGQRVVGDVEEITINGRRVKRFCFRVVPEITGNHSELPDEPQSLDGNPNYQD